MENIFRELEKMLEEDGHQKVLLPLLIPEDILAVESEHIKGFEEEVFWITQGGNEQLERRLALRPTSEVILYYMFRSWLRSYKDLPVKLYQRAEVFRYETKATRPLLRVRQVYWNEAHCVHLTEEECMHQVMKAIEFYEKLFREICALENLLVVERPAWDRFAGAERTFALDCYIELTGRTVQVGTSHHLGQKFTKAFGVRVKLPDGSEAWPYSNSYGISCRVLGALILTHSDDVGLILPPRIAPVKAVVVPILYKGKEEEILEYAKEVVGQLQELLGSAVLDTREERPGWKFYYWEMKGVPLRAEVGPKDLENRTVTLVRRDTREKLCVKFEELGKAKDILEDIQRNLRERSKKMLENAIKLARTMEELEKILAEKKVALVPFCSTNLEGKECAEKIKQQLAAEVLGVDLRNQKSAAGKRCIVCGKPATVWVYVAKKY